MVKEQKNPPSSKNRAKTKDPLSSEEEEEGNIPIGRATRTTTANPRRATKTTTANTRH
jgi:hypothetical protein